MNVATKIIIALPNLTSAFDYLFTDVTPVHNVRQTGEYLLQVQHRGSLHEAPLQARAAHAWTREFE